MMRSYHRSEGYDEILSDNLTEARVVMRLYQFPHRREGRDEIISDHLTEARVVMSFCRDLARAQ